MYAIRRITANLPKTLVEDACSTTGMGLTETLIMGLELVRRTRAASKAKQLRGKLHLRLDVDASRERPGH